MASKTGIERAMTAWLMLDISPSMQFGTALRRKADVAEGVSLAIGHVSTRRCNRLGVVAFGGRVWVIGGGSGHGFKFGPAWGERVAQTVLDERAVDPFFGLGRLARTSAAATPRDLRG